MSDSGKGDWYRKVDQKKFDENYDRIFGNITEALESTVEDEDDEEDDNGVLRD